MTLPAEMYLSVCCLSIRGYENLQGVVYGHMFASNQSNQSVSRNAGRMFDVEGVGANDVVNNESHGEVDYVLKEFIS